MSDLPLIITTMFDQFTTTPSKSLFIYQLLLERSTTHFQICTTLPPVTLFHDVSFLPVNHPDAINTLFITVIVETH